jgi:hypothetical protein
MEYKYSYRSFILSDGWCECEPIIHPCPDFDTFDEAYQHMSEVANNHLDHHIMQDDHTIKPIDDWTLGIYSGDEKLIETWVVRRHH